MRYLCIAAVLGGAMFLALRTEPAPAPVDRSYDRNGARRDGSRDEGARPNLILIVLDTLRRDAARLPDEAGGTMPALQARMKQGVAFRNAIAPSSWTPPSMASLLTGLMPRDHRCTGTLFSPLSAMLVTYPEILRSTYGYETVAFSDSPWFPHAADSILQGFRRGVVGFRQVGAYRYPAGYSLQESEPLIDGWLEERDASRPFAMLLHSYDAHEPYGRKNKAVRAMSDPRDMQAYEEAIRLRDVSQVTTLSERVRIFYTDLVGRKKLALQDPSYLHQMQHYGRSGYREDPDRGLAAHLKSAYDDGCRWVDDNVERTMRLLAERGLLENTLVVITSDHGEAFGEHDTLGHGHHLHTEVARIPLLFQGPGPFATPQVIDEPVGLIDVFPTFFDWAGIEPPASSEGRSLLPLLAGRRSESIVESELFLTSRAPDNLRVHAVALTHLDWRFVLSYDTRAGTLREQLYHVAVDRNERKDLAQDGLVVDVKMPDVFCEAIDTARDRLWREADEDTRRARFGDVRFPASISSRRPAPCTAPVK